MEFTRREQIIILVIILIAVGGTGVIFWSKQKPSEARAVPVVEQKKEPALPKNIMVYMSGAVSQPGVVTVPAGSRVMDALKLAGGPSSGANLDAINLAALLVDGQQVRIPNIEEPGSISQTAQQRNTRTGLAKISINIADVVSLDTLPGIGPGMAQRIIDYRTANGPFSSLEDLKKVPGIGESKYQNLKDKITL